MQLMRASDRRSSAPRRGLFILFLVLLLTIGTASLVRAGPFTQSAMDGQALFQEKCTACHTIGQGDKVGPDLKDVTLRRDRAWLTRWLSVPDQMVAQGDPIATQLLQKYNMVQMPNFQLTDNQVASLIAYLETQVGAAPAPQPSQPQPVPAVPAGDPLTGKAMFTGVIRFQNGGPPCMGCHSIAGIGALGGGALGPDLTPAFNKYGAAGLANVLATVPFPTMNAVWSQHPLTAEEQANLAAFLQQASVSQRPAEAAGQLAGLAVGGAALLLVLAQLYWRRRLTAVRRPLVARSVSRTS